MSYIGHYCCESSDMDLASNKFTIVEINNSNFTASKFIYYSISTSTNAVIATLPTNPANGDWVGFIDRLGTFATHNLTVDNGSNLIRNNSDDLVVDLNYINFRLVYNNGNWNIFDLSIGVMGGGSITLTTQQYTDILNYIVSNYKIKYNIIPVSTSITLASNNYYSVTTPVATLTLPTTATNGDWIIISDKNGTFSTSNVSVVCPVTSPLTYVMSTYSSITLDVDYTKIQLVYSASNKNWEVLSFN